MFRVEKTIRSTSLAAECASLAHFKAGFINAIASFSDRGAKQAEFEEWYADTITRRSRESGAALTVDAITLARNIVHWKVEDVEKWYVFMSHSAGTDLPTKLTCSYPGSFLNY